MRPVSAVSHAQHKQWTRFFASRLWRPLSPVIIIFSLSGQVMAGVTEDELLRNAAWHLDTNGIQIALRQGANPNAINKSANAQLSILAYAIQGIDLADTLQRENGDTKGAKSADIDGVKVLNLLFKKGTKLSESDANLLFMPIAAGRKKVVEILLEHGADPHRRIEGYLPTQIAIKYGQEQIYQMLLTRNAIPVSKSDAAQLRLITVAGNGNLLATERALKDGAKVNMPDICGETALISALSLPLLDDRNVTFIDQLLAKGADANLPANTSCREGSRTYPILQVYDGAKNMRSTMTDTPNAQTIARLNMIADRQLRVVEKLLRAGANINVTDEFGNSILHQAARWEDNELAAEWLILQGADVNLRNNAGKKPIDLAVSKSMGVALMRHTSSAGK